MPNAQERSLTEVDLPTMPDNGPNAVQDKAAPINTPVLIIKSVG